MSKNQAVGPQKSAQNALASLGRVQRQITTVLSLKDLCIKTLVSHADHLGDLGDVPFDLVHPVLQICTADQLLRLEKLNPNKTMAAEDCWQKHCERAGLKQLANKTWKQTYVEVIEARRIRAEMAMQKVREKNAAAGKGKTSLGNRAILMSETESIRSPLGHGGRAAAAFRKANQKPIPRFMQAYLREKLDAPKLPVFKKK